jgi:hypothetical protein
MLFAHLKRILGLDRVRLRGPSGAKDEFLLAATAQNPRKLAKLIPRSGADLRHIGRGARLARTDGRLRGFFNAIDPLLPFKIGAVKGREAPASCPFSPRDGRVGDEGGGRWDWPGGAKAKSRDPPGLKTLNRPSDPFLPSRRRGSRLVETVYAKAKPT